MPVFVGARGPEQVRPQQCDAHIAACSVNRCCEACICYDGSTRRAEVCCAAGVGGSCAYEHVAPCRNNATLCETPIYAETRAILHCCDGPTRAARGTRVPRQAHQVPRLRVQDEQGTTIVIMAGQSIAVRTNQPGRRFFKVRPDLVPARCLLRDSYAAVWLLHQIESISSEPVPGRYKLCVARCVSAVQDQG